MKLKLREKVLIIVAAAWIACLIGTYIISENVIMKSYEDLERLQVISNMNRATNGIEKIVDEVDVIALDWGSWDDSYTYVIDHNKTFEKSNLGINSLVIAKVSLVMIYDSHDNPVFRIAIDKSDPENAKEIPLPDLTHYLNSAGPLLNQPKTNRSTKGIVKLPDNSLLLISARPISTSDGKSPSRGAMILAEDFSDQLVSNIAKTTNLDISLYNLTKIEKDPVLTSILKKLAKEPIVILPMNDKFIHGYTLLKDVYGAPVAILQVTSPRTIYINGIQTIRYYNIEFLVIAILLTFILWRLLYVLIVKRLERLNREVSIIGEHQAFYKRVHSSPGADEISSVSNEINHLLIVIQKYHHELHKTLKRLKRNRAFLTDIVNSMPSILATLQQEGQIVHWNKAAELATKVNSKEAKGKSVFDLLPFLENYKDKFKQAIENKTLQLIDKISYMAPNNRELHYYSITIYPLRSQHEKVVLRIDDITEKVKIEEMLSQKDKLASIGVLTAGVAHEINNPINFISAAIAPLKNNIEDIKTVLNKYAKINPGADMNEQLNAIADLKKYLDFDYTMEETYRLLTSMQEGTIRTAEIVKELKTFSRLDEDTVKKTNLHEGIDSTLTMLRYSIKNRIEVIKDYGNIPEVDCYPGKINQVFMNILSNAIDAIHGEGKIWITTKCVDDTVILSFKDSGSGMPKMILSRIFEPFFTTKDVNKGAGLGLSITYSIIRDHNGTIEVNSEIDQGTEFIITLPIEQPYMRNKNDK